MKYYLLRGFYFFYQVGVALRAISPQWLGHTCKKALDNEYPYDYYSNTDPDYSCMVYADTDEFDCDVLPDVLVDLFESQS